MYRRFGKRWLDVVVAGGGLLGLVLPMLGIALMVRMILGNPVFFRQQRPGLHGRLFAMVKFRTMTDEVDSAGRLLSDDQRLTSFGKFMRKTSVDEFPELWNVFKGDMSLVGPRPLLVEYLPFYTERESQRHMVRPGITGLAQVSGRNDLGWDQRLELDVKYVEELSFWKDIWILWRTFLAVVSSSGVSADSSKVEPNLAALRGSQEQSRSEKNS